MKKVALITKNKILAQSLDAAMKAMPDLEFEFILLLNTQQALIDAEIFEIDVALIDMIESGTKETPLSFCEGLNKMLPNCHILLLLSQDDHVRRKIATEAKKKKIVDDFVFYDASLKYLFAKLTAF
jgi:DNA-binding NarL/FixJ family response regulator